MEPSNWKEQNRIAKQRVAPNAEESCKHCGLWREKIIESRDEYFKCSIDYNHRYCEGKCSKYKKKISSKIKDFIKKKRG